MKRFVSHVVIALVAGFSMTGMLAGGLTAQEAIASPHPSHVHAGSCAELDPNPAYPLADVAPVSADAESGAIEVGTTTIEAMLDELLAGPHAINVHASNEDIATYIACGDIAGPVVDGRLAIGLYEQNGSGYSGVAVLAAADGGTEVTVYLGFGLSGAGMEMPVASPEAADVVEVSIVDFGFDGETVEVPVGTTVRWTNDGLVIHTTTSTDGLWDSAIMDPGDTFSFTFDEAGTYEYLCSLHPNMVGTIVVTDA
jgi:plastocyanin